MNKADRSCPLYEQFSSIPESDRDDPAVEQFLNIGWHNNGNLLKIIEAAGLVCNDYEVYTVVCLSDKRLLKSCTAKILEKIYDRRDVYGGYPNVHGEGPGHHVVCADFDKDGDEESLVALRGPSPNQGVHYYKPIDLSRGLFAKWKVTDDSAARIAVVDFNNNGLLGFATIGYYVPGYYIVENPSINIYYNRFANKNVQGTKELQVTKQNNELLFKVPRPHKALQYEMMPFITIGGITLSLEVIPSNSLRQVDKNTYIKVLSGVIMWIDSSTELSQTVNHSRTFVCKPKTVSSLRICSNENVTTTGNEGVLLIVLKMNETMDSISRFDSIQKVTIENVLSEYCSEEVRNLSFQFIRCDEYDWKKEKCKGLEFYNMKGFEIKFVDNDEHLCYIQLWAAAQGTNCEVHNHSNISSCEVHACIINSTGKGGMMYLINSKEDYDPLTTPNSQFQKLEVSSLYEHGLLWDIDEQKKPVLRKDGTVLCPWYKWQSATDDSSIESFDIWIAFEFNAQLSIIS
ncbi:unnamed protein product [Rotaria sordida]|uniref:Aldos-2-ulose dehydratase/isomerase (AUDH) Cupin domain-containing protein n=1 Tax=Rotaria sordida TaxID=392033 RepID=A0A814QLC1_9BILA|nr:unnamed protein product [Rotaria sordida]